MRGKASKKANQIEAESTKVRKSKPIILPKDQIINYFTSTQSTANCPKVTQRPNNAEEPHQQRLFKHQMQPKCHPDQSQSDDTELQSVLTLKRTAGGATGPTEEGMSTEFPDC